jgi:predicted nucleic acid-binding protein
MLVIADSSALVALATCDGLQLLLQVYGDIKVPKAVFDEVVVSGKAQASVLEKFLQNSTVPVDTTNLVLSVGGLGQGELEAMALYKQLSADALLIDDHRAKAIAEFNQIHCIGTLGLLLLAKRNEEIESIAPYIEKLRSSSLHFSDDLLDRVLKLADE